MQLFSHELAIGILADEFTDEGQFPDPRTAFNGKADARAFLVELTGEDFGENVQQWREWFAGCDKELLRLCYEALRKPRRHSN